ncbi:MFS transporter [Streptomyces sp. HNM0663]|uniref:MFS transporter n=1 Tax=Streptomyces chengmaiensis TaxID=3040919 RepID=A0ABT6HKE9_9ACTN|nr:MFS transporter [Streptomyces chengmaiensis]MDH2389217.1 MFS transporter [Streptomyces chengmaiensis]
MLELLTDRTYIRYWLAVVASFLGDAITKITLIYVVATETANPVLYVSLVVIAQLLPSGVLGAFVGPLADRLPARLLMVGSDLVRAVLALAMIAVRDAPLLLLTLILLSGAAKAVFETARITAIPLIVRGHSIPTAVALFQSTNHTLNLVGPALGGLLLAFGSVTAVFVIDAATFVVSAVLLASMAVLREVPAPGPDSGRESYWQSLRTGVGGVLAVPSLRFLAVVLVPVMLALGLFTTNLNSQLLAVFGLGPLAFGLAQAAFGAGSIAGALTGPPLVRRFTDRKLLIGSIVLFGASLLLLDPTGRLRDSLGVPVVLAWCLLAGLGSGLFQVPVANTLLSDLPEHLRGRGVGLLNALMVNFTILGVVLGGVVADAAGIAESIIFTGALLLPAAALLAAVSRRGSRRTGHGGTAVGPTPADSEVPR